jgi:hypothetical protein
MQYFKLTISVQISIFIFILDGISLASYHEIETQYNISYSHPILSLTHTTTPKNGCLKKQGQGHPTFSIDEIRKCFPTRLLYLLEKT